jgi:hypothetical protein
MWPHEKTAGGNSWPKLGNVLNLIWNYPVLYQSNPFLLLYFELKGIKQNIKCNLFRKRTKIESYSRKIKYLSLAWIYSTVRTYVVPGTKTYFTTISALFSALNLTEIYDILLSPDKDNTFIKYRRKKSNKKNIVDSREYQGSEHRHLTI